MQAINPWLTIWYKPKVTMRYILDNYPRRLVHTLAILGAFTYIAGSSNFLWYTWWATLILWVLLSILTGLVTLYIFGGILKWTGSWLKGAAGMQEIMSAIAWAQIPVIYFFIIEMILLAIFRGDSINIAYATVRFLFAIWAFVIFLCCLEVAQAFSFFKALINYLLAVIIMVIILIIIGVIIGLFASPDIPPQTSGQSG